MLNVLEFSTTRIYNYLDRFANNCLILRPHCPSFVILIVIYNSNLAPFCSVTVAVAVTPSIDVAVVAITSPSHLPSPSP